MWNRQSWSPIKTVACCVAAIVCAGGLYAAVEAERPHDAKTPAWTMHVATDAEHREVLQIVLDADTHWPMRPQPPTDAPITERAPLVLLDMSFAFGKDRTGNVYPDPACRDDAVGKAIADEGGAAVLMINDQTVENYPKALGGALVLENGDSHALTDPQLPRLTVISAREVDGIFRAKPRDWDRFFQQIPGAAGYVQVSRAVLGRIDHDSETLEEAMIYVYAGYRPDCGIGTLYTLYRSHPSPLQGWQVTSMSEPSSKPWTRPTSADRRVRRPAEPIVTGPDAGKVPGLDVQIQLVKDQRTVDLIGHGTVPEDFVPEPRQKERSVSVKLADSRLRFAIITRNTGTELWPRGTELYVVVKCGENISMSGGAGLAKTIGPGEFDVSAHSAPCPYASDRMSIHVQFDTGRSSEEQADAATLDVQLLP